MQLYASSTWPKMCILCVPRVVSAPLLALSRSLKLLLLRSLALCHLARSCAWTLRSRHPLDRDVLAIPRYVGGCCVLIGIFQCGWRAESSYEVYDSGAMSV